MIIFLKPQAPAIQGQTNNYPSGDGAPTPEPDGSRTNRGKRMSVKITVSATERGEFEEIVDALRPVIYKRGYRVRKKPPSVSGKDRYVAHINTRDPPAG